MDIQPSVALLVAWISRKIGPWSLVVQMQLDLHRSFMVQQAKRKAAQGKPVKKRIGIWLSGGFDRTIVDARESSNRNEYRTR